MSKVKVTEIYKSPLKFESVLPENLPEPKNYFCRFFKDCRSALAYIDLLSETLDLNQSNVEFVISFEKNE